MITTEQKCVLTSVAFQAQTNLKKAVTSAGFSIDPDDNSSTVHLKWTGHVDADRRYFIEHLGKYWMLDFASYKYAKKQNGVNVYSEPVTITTLNREDEDQWHMRIIRGVENEAGSAFIQTTVDSETAASFGALLGHDKLYINVRPMTVEEATEEVFGGLDHLNDYRAGQAPEPNGVAERRDDLKIPSGLHGGNFAGELCRCNGKGCDRCLELGG